VPVYRDINKPIATPLGEWDADIVIEREYDPVKEE